MRIIICGHMCMPGHWHVVCVWLGAALEFSSFVNLHKTKDLSHLAFSEDLTVISFLRL